MQYLCYAYAIVINGRLQNDANEKKHNSQNIN